MTLSEILSAISTHGWLVRYLGQLADGRWYACLWQHDEDGIYLTPDRIAADPAAALALAFEAIHSARHLPYARPSDSALTSPEFTLGSLGLIPKPTFTSPLRRRL